MRDCALLYTMACWVLVRCVDVFVASAVPSEEGLSCPASCRLSMRGVKVAATARHDLTYGAGCRFDTLQRLDLQSNRLTSVESLASCTALEELCLCHNGLTDVQASP